MSILFGLLLARRFYCRSALSLSPGRTGGLLPRINAPAKKKTAHRAIFLFGASNRARTCDTAVNSRVLCQLSY